MTTFEVIELTPQTAAVVRAEVPMAGLTAFFDRAFGAVMAAMGEQGLAPAGPPFAYYPRTPTDTVEVVAGFPVTGTIAPSGEVEHFELPGGRAVRGMHVGPYDRLEATYTELQHWVQAEGLTLAAGMWECYLSDPRAQPDPETWQTLVVWPLAAG